MPLTITRNLEWLPDYPMLCKLAAQNQVRVSGNERTGCFAGRGVEGNYEFGEASLHGTFAGHGMTGTFRFEAGKATVTIINKPFWLPGMLLAQKITAGLDNLRTEFRRPNATGRLAQETDREVG